MSEQAPDIIKKITALVDQEGPLFQVPKRAWWSLLEYRPWISVDRKYDHYSVMLASGRTTHHPFHGPAYMVDFNLKSGELDRRYNLTGAWKSAISMWPIRDDDQAKQVYRYAKDLIERCHAHYCAL